MIADRLSAAPPTALMRRRGISPATPRGAFHLRCTSAAHAWGPPDQAETRPDKRRATVPADGLVKLLIYGVGIRNDVCSALFHFGFTTKLGGHRFCVLPCHELAGHQATVISGISIRRLKRATRDPAPMKSAETAAMRKASAQWLVWSCTGRGRRTPFFWS